MHLIMCNLLFCEMIAFQSLDARTGTTSILLCRLTALDGHYKKCLRYSGVL